MRITFKQHTRETGLRAVCAGPRGWDIKVNGKRVGSVSWVNAGIGSVKRPMGWFFVVSDPFPYINTCDAPLEDSEQVKANAKAYIQAAMRTDSDAEKK